MLGVFIMIEDANDGKSIDFNTVAIGDPLPQLVYALLDQHESITNHLLVLLASNKLISIHEFSDLVSDMAGDS